MKEDPIRMKIKRRSLWRKTIATLFVAGITASIGLYMYWTWFADNRQHVPPDFKGLQKPLYYQGHLLPFSATGSGDALKLPFDALKEWLDPSIWYEEPSQSVILTTKDKVVRLKTDQLNGIVNEKEFSLRFPVEKADGKIYVPLAPLNELYGAGAQDTDSGAVLLNKAGDSVQWAEVAGGGKDKKGTKPIRTEASRKAPITEDVPFGGRVMVWEQRQDWSLVQTESGIAGYMRASDLTLTERKVIPMKEEAKPFVPWKAGAGPINLTWEHVITKNPDTAKIGQMPGANIVSPTWFHVMDEAGNLKNLANPSYVTWAHGRGLQVWALFSNGFDPKLTSAVLATYDMRMKMIKQLLSFAQLYKLDGFNIDFENVNVKDKDKLTQFVREMTPLLHEQGLVVSIDVTFKSTNDSWSVFYDRKALAQAVDYMMVMAYDEHWASSPVAGSVASLPWVEQGLSRILKEDDVPPSKVVLGMPFYTRVWTETTKEGKPTVTSKSVGMDTAQKLLADKKATPTVDDASGQNYAEFKDGSDTVKIWLEDELSIRKRIDIARKYKLAGVASWRRGFEANSIWPVIQDELAKP